MLVFSFLVLDFDLVADGEVDLEGTHNDHVCPLKSGGWHSLYAVGGLEMRMASWRWPHAVLVLSDRIPGDLSTPVTTRYGSGW